MRTIAIEINDAGLVVADEQGVVRVDPGFAAVEGKKIVTGEPAFAGSRMRPRETSQSHWLRLSIESGSTHVPGVRSSAELAHAQLDHLWQQVGDGVEHVILVVPSTFDGDRLGILLGLAQECGMPVGAIVDAAVAASVRPYPERQLVYVDADLHHVYVAPLEQSEKVAVQPPSQLESMGLSGLMDAFARRIGEHFVRSTRFDPFHRAATEQLLYDGLTGWLSTIDAEGRAELSIPYGDETFTIELERSQLLGAAQGFYRAVQQLIAQSRSGRGGLVIEVAERLATLPGFEEQLARLDDAVIVGLPRGFAASAALAAQDALGLETEPVKLFRRLPWREAPEEIETNPSEPLAAAPAAAPASPRPTHVVYQGIAYSVNGEGLVVGRSRLDHRRAIVVEANTQGVSRMHCEVALVDGELRLRDLSSFGTFVNERRIEGEHVLKPADVIRVGSPGAELTVVLVEEADGP
jgi:hypothetical protein